MTEVRLPGYTSLVKIIMVAVAQLAERQIVDLEVAGSKPVGHPKHAKVPRVLNSKALRAFDYLGRLCQ